MKNLLQTILNSGKITISLNLFVVCLLLLLIYFIYKLNNKHKNMPSLYPVELELDICNTKSKFKVMRNSENLYVANRIYLELVTRKAAIEINPEYDVINEVYNSWYKLFDIIRNEIKGIPGEYLENKYEQSNELIELSMKILNNALRPHLTKYQAEFKAWLRNNEASYGNKTPQEIQKSYPKYQELINDMKNVNLTLCGYAEELKKFIYNPIENSKNQKRTFKNKNRIFSKK